MPFKNKEDYNRYMRGYKERKNLMKCLREGQALSKQKLREQMRNIEISTVYNFQRRMLAYVIALRELKEFKAFSKEEQESRTKAVLAQIDRATQKQQIHIHKLLEEEYKLFEAEIIRDMDKIVSMLGDVKDE